jgi:hypothetical protein
VLVQLQPDQLDVALLLVAEQVAGAADVEVLGADGEPAPSRSKASSAPRRLAGCR